MIRKWFEHKFVAYLGEREAYGKETEEFSKEWIMWSRNHRECRAKPGICSCPPQPKAAEKPVLKDCTTSEEDGCNLSDLLEHPRAGDMCEEFWVRSSILGPPVMEVQDGQRNQNAGELEEKA